jgi:hypothetical protein
MDRAAGPPAAGGDGDGGRVEAVFRNLVVPVSAMDKAIGVR